jgi:hypothetical protein
VDVDTYNGWRLGATWATWAYIFETRHFGGFPRKRDILAVGSGSMAAWSGDRGEVLCSRLQKSRDYLHCVGEEVVMARRLDSTDRIGDDKRVPSCILRWTWVAFFVKIY